jgi:hypothetical protein
MHQISTCPKNKGAWTRDAQPLHDRSRPRQWRSHVVALLRDTIGFWQINIPQVWVFTAERKIYPENYSVSVMGSWARPNSKTKTIPMNHDQSIHIPRHSGGSNSSLPFHLPVISYNPSLNLPSTSVILWWYRCWLKIKGWTAKAIPPRRRQKFANHGHLRISSVHSHLGETAAWQFPFRYGNLRRLDYTTSLIRRLVVSSSVKH